MSRPPIHPFFDSVCRLPLCLFILPPLLFISEAQSACSPWSDKEKQQTGLVVGAITLQLGDVFDSAIDKENRWFHSLANKLHINTREEVVRRQLLFSTGEPFKLARLQESERALRRNNYIRAASVKPTQICDQRVDILVKTGDNWTLTPGLSVGRVGGVNRYSIKIEESNIFGTGKGVLFKVEHGLDRTQNIFRYADTQLFGSRQQLFVQLQDNSDGELASIRLSKPFYSLDSRRAWKVSAFTSKFNKSIYDTGDIINRMAIDSRQWNINLGRSRGLYNGYVLRWNLGWQHDEKKFSSVALFPDGGDLPERRFSFPYVGVNWSQPLFLKKTNLQLMESVEDISIGQRASGSLGYSSTRTGGTVNAWVLSGQYNAGWQPNDRHLLLFNTRLGGYSTRGGLRNFSASASIKWWVFQSHMRSFYLAAAATGGYRLFPDVQLVIGGDSGLRAYPLRIQAGDRRVVLTAEQRFYIDWYPLRMARIGAAVFADVGSAWYSSTNENTWLRDAGIGLRIVSTRQTDAKVLHIDLAFPLDGGEDLDDVQLVIKAKQEF